MTYKNQFFVCAFLSLFIVLCNDLLASGHPISKSNDSSTEWSIPFRLVHKLIMVEAYVNGEKGIFIVDTGSEFLVLNSSYVKGDVNPELQASDFGGNNSIIKESKVRFAWPNRKAKSFQALVSDLGSIEKILNIKLMGYIGYEVLKRNEIIFDYQNRKLTLFELDRKGNRKTPSIIHEAPSDTISLKRNSFQPYLNVSVGTEQFRFGIDSGASINLLNEERITDLGSNFQKGRKKKTIGFNGKEVFVSSGVLGVVNIQDFIWPSMKCVVKEIDYLNRTLYKKIDGLLGYEFLKQYKISINYRKNQMYIWNPENLLTDVSSPK